MAQPLQMVWLCAIWPTTWISWLLLLPIKRVIDEVFLLTLEGLIVLLNSDSLLVILT